MWRYDSDFVAAAELVWAGEPALARSLKKGHADADRRMADRYEGWQLLKKLAAIEGAAKRAGEHLRRPT